MRILASLAWAFLAGVTAFAQTDRGTITGTITDPTGAVVADAPVEARNVETGGLYQTASSATGNYTLSQLPAGNYEMTVAVSGFKRFVRQNIAVSVAGTLRIDVSLEVGTATESITVSDAATLLKTESGELSHNMTTDRLNNLPVINLGFGAALGNVRNPLQAVTLIPGSFFTNDNALRLNGMPANTHSIRIEGQDATSGINRQINQGNQASLDAIQEVTVQTSNYAAEYGQAGAGYFNYTMRSGTNQWHGGAYDYIVNEALNAGTPFTDAGLTNSLKAGQHIRNRQRRHNYGFLFGGPIVIPKLYDGHDKSFFFFNFEQFRETQIIADGLITVPTEAYRRGDFSAAIINPLTIGGQPAIDPLGQLLFENQIFDPASTRVAPNGTFVRTPYPGNVIPARDMDPVALKIQEFIPLPNRPGLARNYAIPAYTNYRHTTIPSVKLDHNLSSNIKLSGYFSQNNNFTPRNDGLPHPINAAVSQDNKGNTTRINYDHSITPTMLLHLGAGLVYQNQNFLPKPFDTRQLGFAATYSASQFFPNILWGGDNTRGGFTHESTHFSPYENGKDIKTTSNASLTWVRGNHTIKFGGEAQWQGYPTLSHNRALGRLPFAAQQTANVWEDGRGLNRPTGFAYASFLMGRMNTYTNGASANLRLGNHTFAMYIQDSWKVTRKLTIDYGLRYDYMTLIREQYGRIPSASFATPNEAAAGRRGKQIFEATCGCRFNDNYPFAFGPRLGTAYQIDSKTVLRAGVGLMYGQTQTSGAARGANGFLTVSPLAYGEAADLLRDGNTYAVGNRFGNVPVVWPDFSNRNPLKIGNLLLPTEIFFHIDRHAGRPPRIFQYSIGLQREITRDLVVEASYVGNRGVWWAAALLATGDLNPLEPDSLKRNFGIDITNAADRALLTTRVNSPAVLARFPHLANPDVVYPGFPTTLNLNQVFRPRPHLRGSPGFFGPPLGITWYDSLQAKLTKRLSQGLAVDAAFTWQKELNLGVATDTAYFQPGTNAINDVFNYRQNKQISGFSRPFILVVSFRYSTPGFAATGTGMKVLSAVVRDWNIGGVLRYQSGEVIRTPASNNQIITQLARTDNPGGFGGARTTMNPVPGVNRLLFDPNCKCFDPTTQLVLNPAAWTDAPAGTWGTAAPYYNDYRWQRQPAESLSLGRTFGFGPDDRVKIDVRAEMFNVFNRLFLSSPTPLTGAASANIGPNPAAPTVRNASGALLSGYGFVNTFNGAGSQPRTGQIVARLTF